MKFGTAKLFFKPVERYWKDRLYGPTKDLLRLEAARAYGAALRRIGCTRFVGVTGSCGKTTTTELIAAVLAQGHRVRKGSHESTVPYLAKTILSVRPRDHFCVSEVSGHEPGVMDGVIRLMPFHVAVVTHVGHDHHGSFRTLEATAAEKGKLAEAVPATGVVVLNADDPRVAAMASRTRAQVILVGRSLQAHVRAENVSSTWPQRLSLDVCTAEGRCHVQTRLLGEHWVCTVLAAIGAGLAVGVSLDRAARAIEGFDPIPYRMDPHVTADGITFISDTWKAPLWTFPTCLDFLAKAEAERKILVVGSVSDTSKGFSDRYKAILRQALDVVDKIAFVGERALSVRRARPPDDRIAAFGTLAELYGCLRQTLRSGDLVLLKGTNNDDHLHRIVLAWTGPMACWRDGCKRKVYCADCRFLRNEKQEPRSKK